MRSAASCRLRWYPRLFKCSRPFHQKTKSGFYACAITFQTQSNTNKFWSSMHLLVLFTRRQMFISCEKKVALHFRYIRKSVLQKTATNKFYIIYFYHVNGAVSWWVYKASVIDGLINEDRVLVGRRWQRKTRSAREKNPLSKCHYAHHKYHKHWLGMNLGLRGKRTLTNTLSTT